jgi:hypothetical protein
MFVLEQPTEIDGYMASARGLLPSVQLLASTAEHSRALSLVGGFLLESALKAFLSQNDVKDLSNKPFGHDLENLWEEAVKCGLPLDPPLPPEWCLVLNCLHFKNKKEDGPRYALRYQRELHGLSFPVTTDMHVGLKSVVAAVEHALKAS